MLCGGFCCQHCKQGALCCTNKKCAAGTVCFLASDYRVLASSVDVNNKASASFSNFSVCQQLQKATQSDWLACLVSKAAGELWLVVSSVTVLQVYGNWAQRIGLF